MPTIKSDEPKARLKRRTAYVPTGGLATSRTVVVFSDDDLTPKLRKEIREITARIDRGLDAAEEQADRLLRHYGLSA
jgi:hypothetical protein